MDTPDLSPHGTPPEPNAAESYAVAERRQQAMVSALPAALAAAEDSLPTALARLNASPRVKLQRIYRLLDQIGEHAAGHVACRSGCADCCRMNVTISDLEARQIAAHTGRTVAKLTASVEHPIDTYRGVACPFLVDERCSIYDQRPRVCRQHVSFDTSAYWCAPARSTDVSMPRLGFSGVDAAFQALVTASASAVLADIRDFFPGE